MESLNRVPFLVLKCPNLKLKKPPWVHTPYTLVVVSYLLITGGMLYDVAVEPPSVGSVTDDHRHQRPVTSWPKWTVYHGRTCIQLPV
ncbi:hypothetical protein K5549_001670 [Capra hircus]|nr:hypothetical protein K5549_001670 [Capra hircus]